MPRAAGAAAYYRRLDATSTASRSGHSRRRASSRAAAAEAAAGADIRERSDAFPAALMIFAALSPRLFIALYRRRRGPPRRPRRASAR